MKSPLDDLRGSQAPRVRHAPVVRRNSWEEVVDLASAYGLQLDPWQETIIESAMGERSDGRWATPRVGVSVPRQNGKGACIEARELAGLLLFNEQTILHSAHDQKTARVGFDRIVAYFENYDDLRKRVRQVGTALNREYIALTSGQVLRFQTRSSKSGRGFSADCIILDEAQELPEDTWAAALPTVSAMPNPQIWLFGTPPAPGMSGEVFTRFRNAGLEGTDRRLCWVEWSADGADGPVNLDDPEVWASTNPSIGADRATGVTFDAVLNERAAMDDDTFARERLGVWERVASEKVIDPAAWEACRDVGSVIASDYAFAVSMNPSRSKTAVSVAGLTEGGRVQVEVMAAFDRPDEVLPWLLERQEKWSPRAVVIDEADPAWALVDELRDGGVTVTGTKARDMVAACGRLYDGVMTGQVRHLGDPKLTAALSGARRRWVGSAGGWAWQRMSAGSDITPLVSATLAAWGVQAAGIKPPVKPAGELLAF